MKALLVDIDLRVRVIVPDNADEDMVMNAAVARAKEVWNIEGDSFFYENVGEIKPDITIPYNPKEDKVFAYYHNQPVEKDTYDTTEDPCGDRYYNSGGVWGQV